MSEFSKNVTIDVVDKMYTPSNQTNGTYAPKKVFDKDKYLDTSLKAGEKSSKKIIRILPISATDSRPFVEIKTHPMHVSEKISKSKFKSYICLQSPNLDVEGERENCPLCAMGNKYFALSKAEESSEAKKRYYTAEMNKIENYEGLSDDEISELRSYYLAKSLEAPNEKDRKDYMEKAKTYFSKKTYICRVIERGKESQGPKFWRFNARNDEGDAFGQIKDIYDTRKKEKASQGIDDYNIYDLRNGKDLILKITPSSSGKGVAINVTDAGIETPLSDNVELANTWIEDSTEWKDMYSIKNAEYLSIVGEGLIPVWDKADAHYIGKTEKELDSQAGGTNDEPRKPLQAVSNEPSNATDDYPF